MNFDLVCEDDLETYPLETYPLEGQFLSHSRELSEIESEDSDGGTRRPSMERTVSKEELSMLTSIRCDVERKTLEFQKMSKNLNFEVKTNSYILSRI